MKRHYYLKGILLCLCLFIGTKTFAYDAEIDGIYYNLSGDEATVTYQKYQDSSPYYISDYSGVMAIPESVTYNGMTYSVTSIGNFAFKNCSSLTSISIPESVTSIGEGAFNMCYGLYSITIPEGVTSIGSNAFSHCPSLTSITIPESVTSIGGGAFYGCSSLTSVTIPGGVTSIGQSTFYECSRLRSVTIPNSVTSIGVSAFYGCSSLTSVTIPGSVTSIGNYAFERCGLKSITIPNSVTSIGQSAFAYCNYLTSVSIGNSVTSIGSEAFKECQYLTSIAIPNSVTSIGSYAFENCYVLTSVTISEGVTSIGDGAFQHCNSLTGITIPNSVISIGDFAFKWCSDLTSVTIGGSGVTSIGRYAFHFCSGLTSAIISEGVTSIGEYAFSECDELTSVTIPGSVTSIGNWAFSCSSCSNLTSVIVDRATPPTCNTPFSNRANATLYVPYGSKSAYEAAGYWSEFKEIVETANVTIGSTGYATYCSGYDLDFSEVNGLKAYIASGFSPSTGKLVLTRVTEVPAGEGLYIVGDEGRFYIPATTTDMFYSNLLKGVTTATTIYPTDGDYTNFILANGSHGVAFYSLSEAGELAAGKAYLQLPTASVPEVKAISVIFDDDDATGIASPLGETGEGAAIYNLQGQQVNAPKSGLYIINGKKVFIK